MPSRNVLQDYVPHSFYHVYNRGVEKRRIFLDDQDYEVFLGLLKRNLSLEKPTDKYGRVGGTLYHEMELQAFCLMPTHFHLLIYVHENPRSLTELLRSVCTAYTMYFNKKYQRVGSLFQGRYKASRIDSDPYLLHISRYIHRNPRDFSNWKYSSYPYYIKGWKADWVRPDRIYELYEWGTYERFVNDYIDLDYEENIRQSLAGH